VSVDELLRVEPKGERPGSGTKHVSSSVLSVFLERRLNVPDFELTKPSTGLDYTIVTEVTSLQ
jgi:hypothetical protein